MIRVVVCALMAGARLVELAYSQRNLRRRAVGTEGPWTRATFPLIVLVHSIVLAGTAFRGERRPRAPWLAALLGVQPVRAWVLITLGDRWNARAAVPASMTVATQGPYRLIRHPNYAVVVVELLALPMAYGLRTLAVAAGIANAVLLAGRIREEEAALMELPGYREHFESKARLVPGVL
jgi:methyltransferase